MGTVVLNGGVKFAALVTFVDVEDEFVINPASTGNTVNVYPPSGGRINDEPINGPVGIEPGVTGHFLRTSATTLRSIG